MNAHLSRARDYIAIAESADAKREAYEKAADEIIAAQTEDTTLSNREIGQTVGKSEYWIRKLVTWRHNRDSALEVATPFGGEEKRETTDNSAAKRVVRERPNVIADAIRQAPPEAKREFVKAIADDPEVGSAAIEHEYDKALERKYPDPTPEQRRARPRPGDSTADHVSNACVKAVSALLWLGDVVASKDVVLNDHMRESALSSLAQVQRLATHLQLVLEGQAEFDRELEQWLSAS